MHRTQCPPGASAGSTAPQSEHRLDAVISVLLLQREVPIHCYTCWILNFVIECWILIIGFFLKSSSYSAIAANNYLISSSTCVGVLTVSAISLRNSSPRRQRSRSTATLP